MKFAFIAEQKVAFSVVALCRTLEVSPSGYHAWHGRTEAPRSVRDAELDRHVRAAHAGSKGRYPPVSEELSGLPSHPEAVADRNARGV